jgi:chromosome segregation ATPase
MTQSNFSSITTVEAASNIDLLRRHYDANNKTTECVFGSWAWGRRFVRIDKNEKILYRTIYWLFAKLRIFQTEENNPIKFKALKEASENKFKQLAAPYVKALTSTNEILKTEVVTLTQELTKLERLKAQAKENENSSKHLKDEIIRLDKLRAEAVEHIHAFKEEEAKTHEAYAKEREILAKSLKEAEEKLENFLVEMMPIQQDNSKLKEQINQLQKDNEELIKEASHLLHRAHPQHHPHERVHTMDKPKELSS